LNELENLIKNTKNVTNNCDSYDFNNSCNNIIFNNNNSRDIVKRTDSVEMKNCLYSDCEEGEGYKSGGSYLSDKKYALFNNKDLKNLHFSHCSLLFFDLYYFSS